LNQKLRLTPQPKSVAPSRGSYYFVFPVPGAHAPGYVYVAPPALVINRQTDPGSCDESRRAAVDIYPGA